MESVHCSSVLTTCLNGITSAGGVYSRLFLIFACGHKLLCFLRGVKGVTDENGRGLGKVVNVGYCSRTVVLDILLFFNLAAILENMYIFPFPLVTVFGTCLRGL